MRNRRLLNVLALALLLAPVTVPAANEPLPAAGTHPDEASAFHAMFGQGPQESDVYRTDRLLVTATGSQKPVHLAPSVASVITAEDIKDMGATTLDEALETVPGFHVGKGSWFSSLWSIRGIHTSLNPQVLMLVNGVPFTANFTGSRPFTYQMPVAMISRIEVVRGPGSALHGADAFAGVVNVITKDNFEIDGSKAGVRYGSFDTIDTWAQHGGQYGGWDLALGVEWQKTQGDKGRVIDKDALHYRLPASFPTPPFPATPTPALSQAPGPMDTRNEMLDGHLNLRKGDWSLHLYGQLQASAVGTYPAQVVTYGSKVDTSSLLADLSYHNDHLSADWELDARLYSSYMNSDAYYQYFPTAFKNMLGNPISTMNDGALETSATYKGLASHRLKVGVGAKNADYEPDQYRNFGAGVPVKFGNLYHIDDPKLRFAPSANRHFWYALAQDEWQFASAWALTAGVRYDEYSDFGGTVNPRLALVWETLPQLTTKVMYGSAFRAPNFGELYTINNPVNNGDPTNTPEEIDTYELAFDYQATRDLRLLLNLFAYDASDLIETNSVTHTYQNAREQKGQGFETEMDWQATTSVRLRANFAYQRCKDAQTHAVTAAAPEMEAYLNPSWAFLPDWSLDGQYTWIAGRHREQADPRPDIADYDLVNLVLRKKNIAKHWEAAVAVKNLFDEDARIPSYYDSNAPTGIGSFIPNDYPMEGRAIWAEVSCHF